ncbi:MAG: DUF481 domain-containing protein [Pseudomonadota bacterium]
MLKGKMLLLSVCLTVPGLALADPNGWSGEAGLGYIANNGNTSSSAANGKLSLIYAQDVWKNTFLATALGTSSDSVSTGEQYGASDKLDYNFTHNDYAYASVEWAKDLQGPTLQRTVESLGYGRHVLAGPTHILDLEAGVGARQEIVNFTNERNRDVIGRFAGKYGWKISETSNFNQSLKVETGHDNTFTESITEVKVNIVRNIFGSASYTFRNNTSVPVGTSRTDTITALNLSYAFGAK